VLTYAYPPPFELSGVAWSVDCAVVGADTVNKVAPVQTNTRFTRSYT
jgi:hypothetical protein